MRICFVFEGLFPGETRAARHVEALARRFTMKGHSVAVVTTAQPESRDPEGIAVLRLGHPPTRATAKDNGLLLKSIARHLKTEGCELLFAESLTPLSALAVKAAGECGIPTIVRVLADRDGITHSFQQGPRTSPRVVRKKVTTLLEHATLAAVPSTRAAELLREFFEGPTHVIQRCVDLNVFRAGRTTRRDMEAFLGETEARGRRILLYAREQLRESTPTSILPLLPRLREYAGDVLFMVVGELDDEAAFRKEAEALGVQDLVATCGTLEPRAFFAAYEAATLFLVPEGSRATGGELLEAMAMGCPVVCFDGTAEVAGSVIENGEGALVLDSGDADAAVESLGRLLQDEQRLAEMQERALTIARNRDLNVAIDQVETLCTEVLGWASVSEEKDSMEEKTPAKRSGRRSERSRKKPADAEAPVEGAEETPSVAENESPAEEEPRAPERKRRSRRSKSAAEAKDESVEETPTPEEPAAEEKEAPAAEEEPAVETVQLVDDGSSRRGRDRKGRRRNRRNDNGVEELGASTGIDVLDVPAERRRKGKLEPGLALKDLMPFLRPPKTVLVLGCSSGDGHQRASVAVQEGLKGVDRNLVVRHADVLELLGKVYRPPFVRTLLENLSCSAGLYGLPFETTEGAGGQPLPEDLDEVLAKLFAKRFQEVVVDKRPDYLVTTHWLPLAQLQKLKESEKLSAEVVAVVCDPALHDHWVNPVVEHYIVPDEQVKAALQMREVEASSITVCGYPVSSAFARDINKGEVGSRLGIESSRTTVLLRPDGIGDTERVVGAVQSIIEQAGPLNVLVLGGGNAALGEALGAIEAEESCVCVLPEDQDLREAMGVSDVLITRASPHTLAEGLAAGLPMVLLRPSPGMEDRFADRLVWLNGALKAQGEEDLALIAREVIKNRRRLQQMREAMRPHRRNDAALAVVERITRIVR